MTYSLNTLTDAAPQPAPPRTGLARFTHETALLLGAVALGFLVGPAAVQWFGFTGSGLLFVAVLVLASAIVFRFSWSHVAERIGARVDAFVESRREKREMAEDLAVGQRAAKEREETVQE